MEPVAASASVDEIFLEVVGLAVEDEMRGVDPGQAAIFAGLGDRDRFCVREFERRRFGRGRNSETR